MSEKKEKIRKKLAFLSLLQPAQQFFFFADSRKSWELSCPLSEKVLCLFSLPEKCNCFRLIIFRLHDCSEPPWCSCQLMLLSRVAEIRQHWNQIVKQLLWNLSRFLKLKTCVCESLCFPKLCPFHFCICVRVHFAVVYWTVAVILSVSGRLRCYQESHSGASNCSFQAQFASQRSPKGPTGCDIMSVGAEFI